MNDWHVLGAGAIGCLFAARLQSSGVNCCLVLRESGNSSCTIELEETDGPRFVTVAATSIQAEAAIDRLLVTTKAYDFENALRAVRHRLGPGCEILVMVNGMGLLEIARGLLPGATLYAGTTTEGAYRKGPQRIRHAGRGTTRIGAPGSSEKPDWFRSWQGMPLDCSWDQDIESALWHKLSINCAINPLTAIHRVRNGELERDSRLREQVVGLCEEIAQVSEAAGFYRTAGTIDADALEVIRRTAENKSSMLQDILAMRQTEVEFITGYLVRRADALGVDVERNRELLERIRSLEP